VTTLLRDHDLRLDLGRRAREQVLSHYRTSHSVGAYRLLYRQLTVDARLGPEVAEALSASRDVRATPPAVYPLLFACPVAVARDPQGGLSHGAVEPWQPRGDAVAEP